MPTVEVISGFHAFSTLSPQIADIPGMIIHQTTNEPAQMIEAYFNPTIYPKPSTAAPVLTLNTSFAFSANISPALHTRVVKFSFHQPNVATIKSYNPPIIPAINNGLA